MSDTLFDIPAIYPDDTPRVRRTDPPSSHAGADRSASSRSIIRQAVATLIREYGPQTGNDLNDLYAQFRTHHGWPVARFDSPRKRAGELARDGVLEIVNPDSSSPHVYKLRVS